MARTRTVGTVLNKVIERLNSVMRRTRVLEQENQVLRTRLDSVESESFNQASLTKKQVVELEGKVKEFEQDLVRMQDLLKEVIAQLKKTATAAQIKEVQALIDMYNPLKSEFMTREEVERLLDERPR